MLEAEDDVWLLCSACRRPIPFGRTHYVCSVSTCNRDRTRLVFCSVSCWDSHVATLRHRDAWAVETRAPSRGEATRAVREEPAPRLQAPAPRPPAPVARPAAPAPAPAPAVRPSASVAPQAPRPGGSVTAHAGGPALSNQY